MREMKDSGIEWIGKIPNNWRITRIKYVCNSRSEKAFFKHETDSYLGLENVVGFSDKIIETDTTYADGYYDIYKAGDVLFNKLRPYLGKVIIASTDGFCTGEFVKLFNYQGDRRYLRYWMIDEQFITEVDNSTYGAKMPRANPEFVMNMPIPVIPYIEQFAISNYLDTKCAEIDALAADIQSQIDTLEQYKRSVITEAVTKGLDRDAEMKESGMQWVGKMPAHWDCIRGKYILKYMQKPIRENDGVITCFRDGEVTLRSNRREDGFTMSDKEIGYQGIDVGDLVIHGMDGFAGSIGISDSRGKGSPVLNVLDTDQNKKYIMYYLRSMAYGDVFMALATGIRVRSCDLRWNKLAELMYPVPPVTEQEQIVEYIDNILEKTNALIDEKKDQLSTLDAYKKSLIYEYVTGKKEVPAV